MSSAKPIIVLVPGAFHRPSSWDRVISGLRDRGYPVIAHALTVSGAAPSTADEKTSLSRKTPADDVAAIHAQLLPRLDEGAEAVIVSHSYGSIPASVAVEGQTVAERAARGLAGGIRGIVTVAGFAFPVPGKSIIGDDSEPPLMPHHVLEDGLIHLQEGAKPLWYSDLSPAEQDAAWRDLNKVQTRASMCYFPPFITSQIKGIPKTYVLCEQDKVVDPAYQEAFAQVGEYNKVVRLPTGHAPLLSAPERIVDIIIETAAAAAAAA